MSMQRNLYRAAVLLMWVTLPISAWEYWTGWNELPARMAVHFNAKWQPNGYTSREGALYLGLGILVVMLLLFTLATLIIHAMKPPAAWPAQLIAYVTVGVCWYSNHAIVRFNLNAGKGSSQMSVLSSQQGAWAPGIC
jgi:hypothetical protein